MKNNSGIAYVGLLAAVVLIGIGAIAFALFQSGKFPMAEPTPDPITNPQMQGNYMYTTSPMSENTDDETLQKELDATIVGEFETDINSMEEEASEL